MHSWFLATAASVITFVLFNPFQELYNSEYDYIPHVHEHFALAARQDDVQWALQ